MCLFFLTGLSCASTQNLVNNGDFEQLEKWDIYINAQKVEKDSNSIVWGESQYWSDSSWTKYSAKKVVFHKNRDFAYRSIYSAELRLKNDDELYLQTKLCCPLIKDSIYRVEFYVKLNLNNNVMLTTNSLKLGFSEHCLQTFNVDSLIFVKPHQQYIFPQWMKVTYEYKARGKENYFVLGKTDDKMKVALLTRNGNKIRRKKAFLHSNPYVSLSIDNIKISPLFKSEIVCCNASDSYHFTK